MEDFKSRLLKNKKVAVWGIGYLGYTTLLRLQSKGFYAKVYDFGIENLKAKMECGEYPTVHQKSCWVKNLDIPIINVQKIEFVSDPKDMFEVDMHIVSIPLESEGGKTNLLNHFSANVERLTNSFIIFQSSNTPGYYQNHFIAAIAQKNNQVDFATAFRDDWTIEEFFDDKSRRVLSASSDAALQKISYFFDMFDIEYDTLPSIFEAEIYASMKNSIATSVSAMANQVSISYPNADVENMYKLLSRNLKINKDIFGFNATDFRSANYIEHLLSGTSREEFLSIAKETQNSNLSLQLYYADQLINKNIKKVLIMGLSARDTLKDTRLSPSVILAEYFISKMVAMEVDDANFNQEELSRILPNARKVDIFKDGIKTDVVFVMNDYAEYFYINQDFIDKKMEDVRFVIDDIGLFKNMNFGKNTLYHRFGDGNLAKILK